jgi:hypothetical protein
VSPARVESTIARVARFLGNGVADASAIERAADLMALMQEPDAAMLEAGDGDVWRRMVNAALRQRWSIPEALAFGDDRQLSGSDEEGDMKLGGAAHLGAASWVQLNDGEK